MSREIQSRREISATSYNKLKYTTRGPSPDSKAKKEILI
jgi:hypothetical protein